MSAKLVLSCALALVALAFPAASAAEPEQVNYEAALFHTAIPTKDACVFHDAIVDVFDNIDPLLQDGVGAASFSTFNTCTGEFLGTRSLLDMNPISESAFVVSQNGRRGDLNAVVTLFDTSTQTTSDVLLDLRWDGKHQAVGEAEVKGWIKGPDISIHLAPKIDWLRWGGPIFPWAGFWFCSHGPDEPGCIGQ